jgi:DNA-binding NarL/FixJ family response regulator
MAQKKPARIFIVDDHPLIRRGMHHLFAEESTFQICGEAASSSKSLAAIKRCSPDLVILDINLTDGSGLDLIEGILRQRPQLPILVCSVYEERFFAERALRAGARGYVSKLEAAEHLVKAVRKILAGKLYLSSALTERLLLQNLVAGNARQFASPIDKLSDRELQVFEQIGAGHSTAEIAKQLNLSVKTIETHRAHTKEKLNLKNSAELTRYALQWSLQVNRQMLSG